MLSTVFVSLALLASSAWAAPTLYLVGDSTMASHAASEGIQGWGVEVPTYFTGLTVVNAAVSGSSSRSYARDGLFYNLLHNSVKSGDFVVIEFGHNDGGGPTATTTGVAGTDDDTVTQSVVLANGTTEIVHTFGYYVKGMVTQLIAKGAIPIVSAQTPNNPYDGGTTLVDSPSRFVTYAAEDATAEGVAYVDHFASTISAYAALGATTVNGYFPNSQHTHTNTAGAIVVAQTFISGLKCTAAKSVLASYYSTSGAALPARC